MYGKLKSNKFESQGFLINDLVEILPKNSKLFGESLRAKLDVKNDELIIRKQASDEMLITKVSKEDLILMPKEL